MPTEKTRTYQQSLADLLVWGVQRGWQILGRPVNIRLTENGLGYTHPASRGTPQVINVNPKVLHEEHGYQLLQGLILHELGHHFAHFSDPKFNQVFTRCKADGLAPMLNIIEDEHLERRLRALDPGWGEAFDALTSYAFKGKPMVLFIEQYRALLNLATVAEVVEAIREGTVPGTISSWEFGYDLAGEQDRWVSGPELVDLIAAALDAAAPAGRAPKLIVEQMVRIRALAKAGWVRSGPLGILPIIRDDGIFRLDDPGQVTVAKIHISTVLKPTDAEAADPRLYMKRLEKVIKHLRQDFPRLQRFEDEMWAAYGSKWFWNKQRAMLFMLRRNRDFKGAFLPAADMNARKLTRLLGKSLFHPGLILEQLLKEWQPQHRESRQHPLKVSVPWLEVLASDFSSDDYRFLVSLRLGLGPQGAGGRQPVLDALKQVPRNLRKLDMLGLDTVTRKVAACLGECCLAAKPRPPRTGENVAQGEAGPTSGQVIQEALAKQQGDLSSPLTPDQEATEKKEIQAAAAEAAKRINGWLRGSRDLKKGDREPGPDLPRSGVPKGVITATTAPVRAKRHGRMTLDQIAFDLINIATELEFFAIDEVAIPPAQPAQYRKLVSAVGGPIRAMRQFLMTLGLGETEVFGLRQGQRLDPARIRRLAAVNDPGVMVGREIQQTPDLFLGICLDCSSSMAAEDRMDKALCFATLLMEAAKSLPCVECRALGFDDSVIWDVGRAGTSHLAGLTPHGGNNDAAGLLAMARHALLSPRKHRLLIMISDGFPTACSVKSLANLVQVLDDRYRIKSVQVAVATMNPEFAAFPDFTDLTQHEIPVAVRLFGRMIQRILLREYS